MKLYHGSNVEVKNPKILQNNRFLDFGNWFYLTSDFEQASKWAKLITKRRKSGNSIVSVFEIEKTDLKSLKILKFDYANEEWLKYISKNRTSRIFDEKLDIVIGAVANDDTMPILNLYLNGIYDEKEALRRLLPQKLKDQYAFKTEKALEKLKFLEVIQVWIWRKYFQIF